MVTNVTNVRNPRIVPLKGTCHRPPPHTTFTFTHLVETSNYNCHANREKKKINKFDS